ncbi:MAG: Gfo/Idh/MocA family oxidoreductase [Verrucomicrobia bacterium]|nr:Gfo/Idh/MocA family oxidoreductase [Verrucomicrobiota bacterium]
MNHKPFDLNRRRFLKSSAAIVAASTLPNWFTQECEARPKSRPVLSPNDQPAIALIGCGGMGRGDAKNASRLGRIVAVCDVDDARIIEAKKMFPDAATYKDFRKVMERDDIHAVICGTVDHWHTLISLAAMRSGKDVYCEKPLTLTIEDGKQLVRAVKKTKQILQTGSQQRSEKNFRLACELVRNGRIGKLKHITTILPGGMRGGPFQSSPVPEGLDWDLWQGPTADVEYVKERCHFSFRYWFEYSGGTLTDWGAHHNDIALWGSGLDRTGPVSVEAEALSQPVPGGYTAVADYRIEFTYANGLTQTCQSTRDNTLSGGVVDSKGKLHGVKFEGTDGWIFVTRGKIEASDPDMLTEPLPATAERLYVSTNHMGNFFDCMRSRKQPICEAEIGHRSASICHLGAIALQLGRKLKWDPKREQFISDKEGNKFLERKMRKPWSYDAA